MQVKPTDIEKRNAIISSIADILWRAGNRTRAMLVIQLPSKTTTFRSEQRRLEHLINTVSILW